MLSRLMLTWLGTFCVSMFWMEEEEIPAVSQVIDFLEH